MRLSRNRTTAILLASVLCGTHPAYAAELGQIRTIMDLDAPIASPEMIAPYVGEVLALDDLGISVTAASYERADQKDGFVYLYTMREESIPYIIIGRYDMQAENFVPSFTEYMKGSYADLRVTEDETEVTLGERIYRKIVYEYSSGGYPIRDTRMFCESGSSTFMFGGKEELTLDYYLPGGMLEQVASSMRSLDEGSVMPRKHVNSGEGVWGPVMSEEDAEAFPKELRLSGISIAEVILNRYDPDADDGLLIDDEVMNAPSASGSDSDTAGADAAAEGAGAESGENAGTDAGAEAGEAAGTDAGAEAGEGAGTDAGAEAGEGTGTDAGAEAGEAAGTDGNGEELLDFADDISWDEEAEADSGRLPVQFEDGFQLFLPSDWEIIDLMEDEETQGGLFCAGDGSGAENAPFVCVSWASAEGKNLADLSQAIVDQGFTAEGTVRVNGIECISYYSNDLDVRGLVFLHPRCTDFVYVLTVTETASNAQLQNGILKSFGPLM